MWVSIKNELLMHCNRMSGIGQIKQASGQNFNRIKEFVQSFNDGLK